MSVSPTILYGNDTRIITEHNITDLQKSPETFNALLFSLTLTLTLFVFVGSIVSLVSLAKTKSRSTLSVFVTSLSVDDFVSVVPVSVFLFKQWTTQSLSQPLCSTAAFLYLFQGISSHLKASTIILYNFCTANKSGNCESPKLRVKISWVILPIWIISVLICSLPLFGWGTFAATSWGCLLDYTSSYILFLFAIYALCFCILTVLSVPLTHQLLCSDGHQQLPYVNHRDTVKGYLTPSTPLGSNSSSVSPDNPICHSLKNLNEKCVSSEAVVKRSHADGSIDDQHCTDSKRGSRSITVIFAQKRYSLILALTKVILWLPIMIQMVVQHIVGFQTPSFDTLSFLLTLLAATITPLFVLSEHWSHLPCGCIINCKRNAYITPEDTQTKKRRFDFNLSFNKGYGIYKISQENHVPGENSISYHNLINYDYENPNELRSDRILSSALLDFSTISFVDSSMLSDVGKLKMLGTEIQSDQDKDIGRLLSEKIGVFKRDDVRHFDKSTFYEGQERRLSHEEGHKPELTDWEWCRSKSERTPRQRSGGALAIPLCAFQGTVSLHAPTGKTLSLSTYEVSSEGQKITPTSKKIEVYRSKSVGHEPSKEDSPTQFPDTNVKIHLEVLEICENEEAMDTVSIISNISQSSTQARSPSLRYSRKENRFVSCDLGETASYSLFIPTNNPDSDINISIPDTVEAHRQNSKKQHVERDSYQEEIQLLNKAYRKREGDGNH
ncbi:probable G-protein coupled receptor 149 [Spea bombifrons]|uniref:probable G-protein coupled receptor 149 n=1 Tax=Spea bombifrons TaxID=233779 RepID=UPI00234BE64F|nr:probable G-protein coupled receptor 149 [Spea bombifrons]